MTQMGGGGKLRAMLGVKEFVSLAEKEGQLGGLRFRFKGSRKVNLIEAILAPDDTYTMQFYKLGKFECNLVKEFSGFYCDGLISVFEDFTGLQLSL